MKKNIFFSIYIRFPNHKRFEDKTQGDGLCTYRMCYQFHQAYATALIKPGHSVEKWESYDAVLTKDQNKGDHFINFLRSIEKNLEKDLQDDEDSRERLKKIQFAIEELENFMRRTSCKRDFFLNKKYWGATDILETIARHGSDEDYFPAVVFRAGNVLPGKITEKMDSKWSKNDWLAITNNSLILSDIPRGSVLKFNYSQIHELLFDTERPIYHGIFFNGHHYAVDIREQRKFWKPHFDKCFEKVKELIIAKYNSGVLEKILYPKKNDCFYSCR